jgi:uncharacterized phage protein (TIGR01671 family)
MREILFRGKDNKTGEWRYGNLETGGVLYLIRLKIYEWFVDPETVGQYTGLDDRNGVKIFEGDIVRKVIRETGGEGKSGKIVFENGAFAIIYDGYLPFDFQTVVTLHFYSEKVLKYAELEVIGNIHDNPELTEEKK